MRRRASNRSGFGGHRPPDETAEHADQRRLGGLERVGVLPVEVLAQEHAVAGDETANADALRTAYRRSLRDLPGTLARLCLPHHPYQVR